MRLVRRRAATALPLLALCCPALAHAQEAQPREEKSVDARALGSEEIVITAATDPFRSKSNSTTVVESVVVDPLESPAGEWRPIAAYLRAVLREAQGDLSGALSDFELAVALGLTDADVRDRRDALAARVGL